MFQKESDIEGYVRDTLRPWGFKVVKFKMPGTMGGMDRMVLFPYYFPRPPEFVEFKQPSGRHAPIQRAMRQDFTRRGCVVHEPIWSMEQARSFCQRMIWLVRERRQELKDQLL